MAADVAFHLRESPLGQKQKIGPEEDGFVRIDATVPDTSQLRWWLLGFGDQVEVLEPEHLRDEFAQIARSMADMYS
jgi:predicted DNA-binding transcriptional regulator YafY